MSDLLRLLRSDKFTKNSTVKTVSLVRLFVPIYILHDPFVGFVLTCIADYFDAYFIKHREGYSWHEYHTIDKALDWVSYIFMFISGLVYGVEQQLIFWMLFRFVGQVIVSASKKTGFFILFPNIFEFVFVWYVIIGGYFHINISSVPFWVWLSVVILLEELQEVWIHYYWPNRVRKYGYPKFLHAFGYQKKPGWK